MDQIFGYIERITYQSAENGFTVCQLKPPGKDYLTCLVGIMPDVQPGETIKCFGAWKRHPVHGSQFDVAEYKVESPADITGIQKYLGSGLIKGIGPVYAKRIVEKFGLDTLIVIDESPDRLFEVSGLGKKRIGKIKTCWEEQKSIRDVMIFLQKNGVSTTYAQKIFKTYGKKSIKVVSENPYTLAKDIFGIGFKTADKIAKNLGICQKSPQRIDAGIEYVLSELSNQGHVCYPIEQFLPVASDMLEVESELISDRLKDLAKGEAIIISELVLHGKIKTFLWIKSLYIAELGIAKEIFRLQETKSNIRQVNIEKAIDWVQKELNFCLGKNQKLALGYALKEKFKIITGGPGTGKSTIINSILSIFCKLTDRILLAAPTGKAAKRITEITGRKAQTIHSLLEYNFKIRGFKKNKQDPLNCDLIIIDEASMIDTLLMYRLVKAVPSHAKVILVGDIDQLPSVGPGNVLKDIIATDAVSITTLHEIFRQAAGSKIITNAHLINKGIFPNISNKSDSDFFFVESLEPELALKQIVTLVTHRIPKKWRLCPFNDIQVLAPMKKGIIGTENLNCVLQERLNPHKDPLIKYGRRYAPGDKVMQIRNNYDKKVFNGDVGRVDKIDKIEQILFIKYEDRLVKYDFSELDEVVLAYAVSVHKFQGSECPCIVMPVHTTHFKLLVRNLLYTGVTRGKNLVILVGTKKAIAICIKNNEVDKRFTGLQQALLDLYKPANCKL